MYYLIIFSIFAVLSIYNDKLKKIKYLDLFIFISIIFISGTRWQVGGDWGAYTRYYDYVIEGKSLKDSALYYTLNIVFLLFKLDILGKNIIVIILFLIPFFYVFKKFHQNIYLSLSIFFPIIFIIYGLGSIRQGLAMSYFFLFLYYEGSKFNRFLIFLTPFLFHNASIVLYLLYISSKLVNFESKKNFFLTASIFLAFALIIVFFNYDYILDKVKYYIMEDTYHSTGAPIRAILLSFFSFIFLIRFKKLRIKNKEIKNFIFFSSIFVIILLPFSFYFSTPVDRILGFFLIIKLMIVNEIIKSIKIKNEKKLYSIIFIIVSYVYLATWIFFGSSAQWWLRYELPFV